MEGYGKKITFYRKERKMSQDELGKRLGVTKSYISKLENERTPMSLETLGKIANILEVHPTDLIDNEIKEPSQELKDVGVEWMMLGKKMEKQGITPEQLEEWVKVIKSMNDK